MEPYCYLCDNESPQGGDWFDTPRIPGRLFWICNRCCNYYTEDLDRLLQEIEFTYAETEDPLEDESELNDDGWCQRIED